MRLVQVRACDGKCCEESPRFPNVEHSDCIFHDTSGGKETAGCAIMRGDATLPTSGCIKLGSLSIKEVFAKTCVQWPHENSTPRIGDTGGCCWQWVE